MINNTDIQTLDVNEVVDLFLNDKLSHLKDLKLTSKQIFEIPGLILQKMILSGILYTEPVL